MNVLHGKKITWPLCRFILVTLLVIVLFIERNGMPFNQVSFYQSRFIQKLNLENHFMGVVLIIEMSLNIA